MYSQEEKQSVIYFVLHIQKINKLQNNAKFSKRDISLALLLTCSYGYGHSQIDYL